MVRKKGGEEWLLHGRRREEGERKESEEVEGGGELGKCMMRSLNGKRGVGRQGKKGMKRYMERIMADLLDESGT